MFVLKDLKKTKKCFLQLWTRVICEIIDQRQFLQLRRVVDVRSLRFCVVRSAETLQDGNETDIECHLRRRRRAATSIQTTVNDDDFVFATCSLVGRPLPFATWQLCDAADGQCQRLTNSTPGSAEWNSTGANLPAGNYTLECMAQFLDVSRLMWSIPLLISTTVGKLQGGCYSRKRRRSL